MNYIHEFKVLPSSQMLVAKLCHNMGQPVAVRFMRNLGIPLEETLLLLGYPIRYPVTVWASIEDEVAAILAKAARK